MDGSFTRDLSSRAGDIPLVSRSGSQDRRFDSGAAERLSRLIYPAAFIQALREPVVATLLVTLVMSLLFILFPIIDRATSAAFYHPHDGFVAADDPVLRALRRSSSWVMGGLLITVIGALIAGFMNRAGTRPGTRRPLCLLLAFAIGPGLLVNGLLKAFWGRARPVNIAEFGGTDPFTSAWAFSKACISNCSITSGEGASAAWMVLVLLLVPPQWRALGALLVVPYAVLLSWNRIAFGGHFLSDVILSWCLTAFVTALVWRLLDRVPVRPSVLPVRILSGLGRSHRLSPQKMWKGSPSP